MRTIRIEEIKLKDLDSFARPFFDRSGPDDILPISSQRVLAHTHNPCARPDDIVLLVVFDGNDCIGYHGLLPGLLKHDNTVSRVFWATTFYLSEVHRGQGIGKLLIEKIKALNVDFVGAGPNRASEKTYLRSGLKTLGPIVFYQLQIKKGAGFKAFHRIQKIFLYRRLLHRQVGYFQEFSYNRIDQINRELKSIKASASDTPAFYRDIEMVNWMLKYPWVLSRDTAAVRKENYHFARVRDIFKYIVLEIYSKRDNAFRGFMVLSISHKKKKTIIKILDYHLRDFSDIKIFYGLSLKFAAHHLADRIDIPLEFQNYFETKFHQKYLIKKKKRSYVYHPASTASPLGSFADNIDLNYCDGDTAFT
jgi:GNAT superfamily N-acetyltransferase